MSTSNLGAYQRRYRLKRDYGITPEDYDRMLAEQDGLCAICGLPERSVDSRSGKPRRLAVDHSHKTGRVRALLCNRCNSSLVAGIDRLLALFGATAVARALAYCAPAEDAEMSCPRDTQGA